MQKKCSSCELVNWADAINCRRCGHALGAIHNATLPRLVGKEVVRETTLQLDDDVQLQAPLKLIRNGVTAGVLGGIVSCLSYLLLNIFLAAPTNFFRLAFIELGIVLALSIGVYYKNRACALLLLGCFTLGKLAFLVQGQIAFVGIFIGLLFVKSIYQGYQGTVQYQKLKSRKLQQSHA